MSLFISPIKAANSLYPAPNVSWNLYLPALKTPTGWSSSISFSRACYESLKNRFDRTSYQVVAMEGSKIPDSSYGKKRDLIIELENQPHSSKTKINDTLIFWLKFRTGFKYSRIVVLSKKGQLSTLPDSVADAIYQTAHSEFLGELNLQGGPSGCTMTIPDVLKTSSPCKIQLPTGAYKIVTTYPNFTTRRDSVIIDPGKVLEKRILLLPNEPQRPQEDD